MQNFEQNQTKMQVRVERKYYALYNVLLQKCPQNRKFRKTKQFAEKR